MPAPSYAHVFPKLSAVVCDFLRFCLLVYIVLLACYNCLTPVLLVS
uniref:Uncharacterized protein n=1 Tax=Arundo donax TaxID=35708 RepID=A0A0A9CK71_ARUDO